MLNIVCSLQAVVDVPVFAFVRPQVTPGTTLYAIAANGTPAVYAQYEWTVEAMFQGDARLTVLSRVVDGGEPPIMVLPFSPAAVGTNACVVIAVEGQRRAARVEVSGANFAEPIRLYALPSVARTDPSDLVLGVVMTNGSSERVVAPSNVVVHANVRDGQFASTQLVVFEILGDVAGAAELVNPQPGLAVSVVIPGA